MLHELDRVKDQPVAGSCVLALKQSWTAEVPLEALKLDHDELDAVWDLFQAVGEV